MDLTVSEAAALLGVNPATVRRACQSGELWHKREGYGSRAPIRISRRDLRRWAFPPSLVHCPTCGSNYTHHDEMVLFDRKEDGPCEPLKALASGQREGHDCGGEHCEIVVESSVGLEFANPSDRRGGVVVAGWCEMCSNRWALRIWQHKGETYTDLVDERLATE